MNIDLSGLRDIHMPIQPDFFPLAWGWWVAFWGIICLLLIAGYIWVRRMNSPKHFALKELKRISQRPNADFLKQVNELLRRAVIYRYGAQKGADLYGQAWIDLLNETPGVHFSKEYVELIEKSMYASQETLTDTQKQEIRTNAECWIRRNL